MYGEWTWYVWRNRKSGRPPDDGKLAFDDNGLKSMFEKRIDHGGQEQQHSAGQRHRALDGSDLRVDCGERRGDADDGETGRAAADGDVHLPLIRRHTETRGAAAAHRHGGRDLGPAGVVLQSGEGLHREIGIAAPMQLDCMRTAINQVIVRARLQHRARQRRREWIRG